MTRAMLSRIIKLEDRSGAAAVPVRVAIHWPGQPVPEGAGIVVEVVDGRKLKPV